MERSHSPHRRLPWGRLGLLILGCLAGGLRSDPAAAGSFYEINQPYYLGMGNISTAVPGGTVDLPTGAVMVELPLLALPGRIHHHVGLFFKSQDGSYGPLGRGTSLSTCVFMQQPSSGIGLDLVLPGHRCFHFEFNPTDNAFEDSRDPEMLGAKFVQGAQVVSGTLTFKNGEQWLFGTYGDLYQVQDRYGNFLQVSPGSGFTQEINYGGTSYPQVAFSYSAGLLSQITFSEALSNGNPPNRAWSVAYDGSNRLSSVADPNGGAWHYTWTTYTRADGQVLPLIATITSPRGYTIFTALYDAAGRITQYTAADQGVTKFVYSAALGSDGTTTRTDPLGHTTSWSYTWPAPPTNETAKFGYRLTSVVDPLGRQTQFAAQHSGSQLITQITATGTGSPPRTGTSPWTTCSRGPPRRRPAARPPRAGPTLPPSTSAARPPIPSAARPVRRSIPPPATSPTPMTPGTTAPTTPITVLGTWLRPRMR